MRLLLAYILITDEFDWRSKNGSHSKKDRDDKDLEEILLKKIYSSMQDCQNSLPARSSTLRSSLWLELITCIIDNPLRKF